jgi:hypothetical protein
MRRLSIVPAVLLLALAIALPSTALAASESTSGYNQTPNTPTTGTSPSKESSAPSTSTTSKGTEPSTSTSTPKTTETEKSGTLPFTGFDLRWSIGFGLLLMGAGFTIVAVQRRQRQDGR